MLVLKIKHEDENEFLFRDVHNVLTPESVLDHIPHSSRVHGKVSTSPSGFDRGFIMTLQSKVKAS